MKRILNSKDKRNALCSNYLAMKFLGKIQTLIIFISFLTKIILLYIFVNKDYILVNGKYIFLINLIYISHLLNNLYSKDKNEIKVKGVDKSIS